MLRKLEEKETLLCNHTIIISKQKQINIKRIVKIEWKNIQIQDRKCKKIIIKMKENKILFPINTNKVLIKNFHIIKTLIR